MSNLELNKMANWEKLNKKFDETIDKLTNEDWEKWKKERKKRESWKQ